MARGKKLLRPGDVDPEKQAGKIRFANSGAGNRGGIATGGVFIESLVSAQGAPEKKTLRR